MKNLILIGVSVFAVVTAVAQASKEVADKKNQVAEKKAEKPAKEKDKDKDSNRKAASDDDEDIAKYIPTHFKKGWKVEVTDYDQGADAFEIAVDGEKEAGPFYFAPEEFLKASGHQIEPKDLTLQKKKDFVGAEVILKEDMRMLTFDEYIARGGKEDTF